MKRPFLLLIQMAALTADANATVITGQFFIGGGTGTETAITGITTDSSGYTYLAGTTSWAAFPTTPGPLSQYHGSSSGAPSDVFVMKLAPVSNEVVWSVLVGGSKNDRSAGIAVDSQGSVYVSGYTYSPDFPMTAPLANSHQPSEDNPDLFVFKLNSQGNALAYSIVLGGTGSNVAFSLALATDQRCRRPYFVSGFSGHRRRCSGFPGRPAGA